MIVYWSFFAVPAFAAFFKKTRLHTVIKRQFRHVKTRYRGIAKNRARLFTLFALGNLLLVRKRLMA